MSSRISVDVVVVGAGQAGLAMGWHLSRLGLRFVVLEAAAELGQSWRSRWDSLTLFTPTQYDALPGMPFPASADTYPGKDAVADYLRAYAAAFDLPVRLNARVIALQRTGAEFEVRTAAEVFRARQVVLATGPFQVPVVPPAAAGLHPSVTQLHSYAYRNPHTLPAGPVLIVGAGNSGLQIAEELTATHTVQVSVGAQPPRLPQRPLGRDLFWWLIRLGLMQVPGESRLGRRMRARGQIIGTDRRALRRAGIEFRPRLVGADGDTVRFDGGSTAEVNTVIWATGYRSDYSWLHVPEVMRDGRVVHRRGFTQVPGMYVLGLSWQHTRGSALLGFVHHDAAYLADRIAARPTAASAADPGATAGGPD
jgi:putative flavoprotein involved in K+ transport